jgi:hypothetical protein
MTTYLILVRNGHKFPSKIAMLVDGEVWRLFVEKVFATLVFRRDSERETSAEFSTDYRLFPQIKIFLDTPTASSCGVVSLHRKSDLPAGESGREPLRESATRLRKLPGNWKWTVAQGSSYSEVDQGRVRETRTSFARTARFRDDWAVVWKPNQTSKKSDRKGGFSQERSPFRFVRFPAATARFAMMRARVEQAFIARTAER